MRSEVWVIVGYVHRRIRANWPQHAVSTFGQFFTPDAIAAFMWSFVSGWKVNRLIRILDNSVGSGRLLQYADPERHAVYGVDVHADVIQQCQKVFEDAGFDCGFRQAGMEDINPANFDIAIINPPFSIHLESPHLKRWNARRGAGMAPTPVRSVTTTLCIRRWRRPISSLRSCRSPPPKSMIAGEQGDRLKRRAAGLFELPSGRV